MRKALALYLVHIRATSKICTYANFERQLLQMATKGTISISTSPKLGAPENYDAIDNLFNKKN